MSETLRQRLDREPGYRPYCLCCSTMARQTPIIKDGRVVQFWCDPNFKEATKQVGPVCIEGRRGCGVLYNVDEIGQGKSIVVTTHVRGAAQSVEDVADTSVPPTPFTPYYVGYDTVQWDETDHELLDKRVKARDAIIGPRLGDYVLFNDGIYGRFCHDWGEDIQWCPGGSFHLFSGGGCSYSGGLNSAILKSGLKPIDKTKLGSFWFFHHDLAGASRGVYFKIPCRVFEVDYDAPSR